MPNEMPLQNIASQSLLRLKYARRKGIITGNRKKFLNSNGLLTKPTLTLLENFPAEKWIQPHFLYRKVLNHRKKYEPLLAKLRQAGLRDPFEITLSITEHVKKLFEKHGPRDPYEKAVLLCRSIVPSDEGTIETATDTVYHGLTAKEGGLEVFSVKSFHTHLMLQYGFPLPQEIITAPPQERTGACLEKSLLLTAFLRTAGIPARLRLSIEKTDVKMGPPTAKVQEHASVLAELSGKIYNLDPSQHKISAKARTRLEDHPDHSAFALYYSNLGMALREQGKAGASIEALNLALEIDPTCGPALANLSIAQRTLGMTELALEAIEKARMIDPRYIKYRAVHASALRDKALAHFEKGEKEAAKAELERIMDIYPDALDVREIEDQEFKNFILRHIGLVWPHY